MNRFSRRVNRDAVHVLLTADNALPFNRELGFERFQCLNNIAFQRFYCITDFSCGNVLQN